MRVPAFLLAVATLGGCTSTGPPKSLLAPPRYASHDAGARVRGPLVPPDDDFDPCGNFYQYACGELLRRQDVPDGFETWGPLMGASVSAYAGIWDILASAEDNNPELANAKIFFRSCQAPRPSPVVALGSLVTAIDAVRDRADFMRAVAELHRVSVPVLFNVAVVPDNDSAVLRLHLLQGGLGLPPSSYATRGLEDRAGKSIFESIVARHLALLNADDVGLAGGVYSFEASLATGWLAGDESAASQPSLERGPPSRLAEIAPEIPWNAYFEALGHQNLAEVSYGPASFFEQVDKAVSGYTMDVLKAYLRTHLVAAMARYLDPSAPQYRIDFDDSRWLEYKISEPQWYQCAALTFLAFPEALDRAYAARHAHPEAEAQAREVVQRVRTQLERRVLASDWLDAPTRDWLRRRFAALEVSFGPVEPPVRFDRSLLRPDDFAGNAIEVRRWRTDSLLAQLGHELDRNTAVPLSVERPALYTPYLNKVSMARLMLRFPFFDPSYPAAVRYARLGFFAAHEFSHATAPFPPGATMSEGGGWSSDSLQAFGDHTRCVRDLYAGYTLYGEDLLTPFGRVDDVRLDAAATFAENVADLVGIRAAFDAYRETPATDAPLPIPHQWTSEQSFFLAYAQQWCSSSNWWVEMVAARGSVHAPHHVRVNAVLRSLPEFSRAFRCKPGAAMRAETACEMW